MADEFNTGTDGTEEVNLDSNQDNDGQQQDNNADNQEDTGSGEENVDALDEDIPHDKIPTRNNAAHIIARKTRTIEKLKAQQNDQANQFGDYGDDEDASVNPKLDAVIETLSNSENERELSTLFTQDPTAKKYEKKIRSYMSHPSYSEVPAEMIYTYLARADKQAILQKKKDNADREASHTTSAGTGIKPKETNNNGMPSPAQINAMSDADFETFQNKVNSGAF